MIRFRQGAGPGRVSREEFRVIYHRSLRKLAFEFDLEPLDDGKPENCEQSPEGAAEFETQYESSIAWLQARERFKSAVMPEPEERSALLPATQVVWADEVVDESASVWTRSARTSNKGPRAPRTFDYSPD